MTRIALIVDDAGFRSILRAICVRLGLVDICGEAGDGEAGLALVEDSRPDLVVVDWLMPGMSGLDLTRIVRAKRPATRVLFCTAFPDPRLVDELYGLRVQGYIDKTEPLGMLETALRTVVAGGLFFASRVGPLEFSQIKPRRDFAPAPLPAALATRPAATLSPREREVAGMVAAGLMSKEIAARLGIAVRTVEAHRAKIMEKLGLSDIPTLTRWCERVGLIEVLEATG